MKGRKKTMKKGIDISYCQNGIDLSKVKAEGVEFAIIRAGVSTRTDTEFYNHMERAVKAGLSYGFYWYSRAFSVEEARKEAEACLSAIKPYTPTYPVFYDMEDQDQITKLDKTARTAIVTAFCEAIRAAGYTAGVYINPSGMENYVDKAQIVGKYDIWLAHWTYDSEKPSKYDYGQTMWQWGIDTVGGMKIDGDICYADYKKPAVTAGGNTVKTVGELVEEVIAGLWGNGQERVDKLTIEGYDAAKVQEAVNAKIYGRSGRKTVEEVTQEVISGKWGNGQERIDKLAAEGYSSDEIKRIQEAVNRMLK